MKNKWSENDLKILNENLDKSYDELIILLKRSKYSIRSKIRNLQNNNKKNKLGDINWNEVQQYYNNNNMWDDVIKKFNINNRILCKAVKNNLFKTRSKSESMKIINNINPKKLSDETKKKISESRKKYLQENPDKVPYLLNHYSKGSSYPEKYFDNILKDKLEYEKYLQVGIYHIDFAIINKKIAIEVDGEQHYLDKKIVESDKRKNEYLNEAGWDIIRIRWSDYKKLTSEEKNDYIINLLNYINKLSNNKPTIKYKDNFNYCIDCDKKIYKTSKRCIKCSHKLQQKVSNRPSKDELIIMVKETSLESVGRKYGVSGNAVKKWLKNN